MAPNQPTPQEMAQFHSVMSQSPSKQATKAFLLTQAMGYLSESPMRSQSRQERRRAALTIARRLSKKIAKGETV